MAVHTESMNVTGKEDLKKWLEVLPEPVEQAVGLNRRKNWLNDRRWERARKAVRRRVKKTLQHLWDIDRRVVSQGLASTPLHQFLTQIMSDLNSFLDDYNSQTSSAPQPR
jgi:hypothetical protein